jgi:hypothetical protein
MKKSHLLAAGVIVGLSACSTGILQSPQADSKISGTVKRNLFQPDEIEVNLDGKIYRGKWSTDFPTPEQKKEVTYPHLKHIGQVKSILKADNGDTLDCHWETHVKEAKGVCTDKGKDYPLILK